MGYTYRYNYRTGRYHKVGSFSGSKVILEGDNWELTLRELIFSFFLLGVLFTIGFFLSGIFEKAAEDKVLKYRQAAQITSPSEFRHAMDTDVGITFVSGEFEALDPVEHSKLPGKHFLIVADYEKYTMHTRVEHYTDSKGRSHSRIRHYWTWDSYKVEREKSPVVRFCGQNFPVETFSYGAARRNRKTVDNGYNKRISFSYIPVKFDASIVGDLSQKNVNGKPEIYRDVSMEALYKDMTTTHATVWFWSIYSPVAVLLLVLFVVAENRWLEDKES